ncbi:hypothetical protein P20311_2660 [Pseudoalteromonas sp. BSi20311]|jgi:hypothetical protein|uniref:hypothetical protein n=1 Tax=unclassified Pseudoalteromonas TaxID=194690 RepID=UPI0002319771|nr:MULTISPECIES: hypothetical protein [unclassified Pseudoalteromonas]GAA64857.1 hypothetical protein P20311_2660 [Pseudoalteromonas sp. BSi20311]GAA70176.1 hypothetical protein P20439_0238 [Pseudoalteromonas sp. BSi20439]HCP98893.1 hypothetical protein [Pseudoalteromonas sp.]|tara:strand:+ start:208 stop:561 length:354 start_codon:yes stop_codon:yes gene_type:complete
MLSVCEPFIRHGEFVQGKYAVENGFVTAKAPEITSVKLVTASHFSYITEKNGQFSYAGGGQYKLTDGQFIETFKYGNIASLMGKTMAFDYKVAGNLWHHSLTENGQLVEAEVWRKIK